LCASRGPVLAIALFASCDEPGLLPVHSPPPPSADAGLSTRVVDERDEPPEPGQSVDAAWAAAIDHPEKARNATDAAIAAIGGGPFTQYRQYAGRCRYAHRR